MKTVATFLPLLGFRPTGDVGAFTVYTTRRGAIVWFPRSPPGKPPSPLQTRIRNRFRIAARIWSTLDPQRKQNWLRAAIAAGLKITGYNLFTYWIATQDHATIETVQRLANLELIPLETLP